MPYSAVQTVSLGVSSSGSSVSVGSIVGKDGVSWPVPGEAFVQSVSLSKPFRLVNVPWNSTNVSSPVGTVVQTAAGFDVVAVLTNGVYVVTFTAASVPYNAGGVYFSNLRIALTSDVTASGSITVGMPSFWS